MRSFARVEADRELRSLDRLHEVHDGLENPLPLDPNEDLEVSFRVSTAKLDAAALPQSLQPGHKEKPGSVRRLASIAPQEKGPGDDAAPSA